MSNKSLAAHVRELVGRLNRATGGKMWCAEILLTQRLVSITFDDSPIRCDNPRIKACVGCTEPIAITAASAAVARWLEENGYKEAN